MVYLLDDVDRPLAAIDAVDLSECEKICAIMKTDYKIELAETIDVEHLDLVNKFQDHINGF